MSHFKEGEHEYDFFCHAWDYNTWKLIAGRHSTAEHVDREWLTDQLMFFKPKNYIIDSASSLTESSRGHIIQFGSLTYSMMISNHLKRMHEFKHNFRYDYVLKCRYDNIFKEDSSIYFPEKICERILYVPHLGRIEHEYNRLNPSDCIFFGDSWGMDIISDLYRYLKRHAVDQTVDNIETLGPGSTMYIYGSSRNVHFLENNSIQEVFYRKECMGLDAKLDYDKILDHHRSFYN